MQVETSTPKKVSGFNPIPLRQSPVKELKLASSNAQRSQVPSQGNVPASSSSNQGNSAKKLQIKSSSKVLAGPAAGQEVATQSLTTLTRSVRAIVAYPPQPTPESLQVLYSLCEGYINSTSTSAQTLYDRIRIELERRIGELKLTLSRSPDLPSSLDAGETQDAKHRWLRLLESEWQAFTTQLNMIRSIFLQLDRVYVLNRKGLLSIW